MVECTQKKSQKTDSKVGSGSTLRVSLTVNYPFFDVLCLALQTLSKLAGLVYSQDFKILSVLQD